MRAQFGLDCVIFSIIGPRQPFNNRGWKMTRGLAMGAGNPAGSADTGMILHRASSLSQRVQTDLATAVLSTIVPQVVLVSY